MLSTTRLFKRTVVTIVVMVLVSIPGVLVSGLAGAADHSTVSWSGYTWNVKSSVGVVGPGPNIFSNSPENVFVDSAGRLHLSIVETSDGWTSAEVGAVDSFGYGRYQWTIASELNTFDPNTVLGMFTWSDQSEYNHREIDIEFSDWGNVNSTHAGSFAVQNGEFPTRNVHIFPPGVPDRSVHTMTWSPGRVDFSSSFGGSSATWSFAGDDVPVPGDEHARMNLWSFQGKAPSQSQTVVLEGFQYTPTPTATPDVTAPPTPTKAMQVRLKAVSGKSKLKVNVNPNQRSWNYRIKIQKKVRGKWRTVKTTRTKGVKDTRVINLRRGKYRVKVSGQRGFLRARSNVVRLRR